MYYRALKKLMKNARVWAVTDHRCYSTYPIAVFFKFEDAKQFWESIAELEWDKVNSSEKSKTAYFKDKPDYEGHWYFSIDEISLSALNDEFAKRIKEDALYEKKEEIIQDAEDSLKLRLRREAREEYRKKILQFLQELE